MFTRLARTARRHVRHYPSLHIHVLIACSLVLLSLAATAAAPAAEQCLKMSSHADQQRTQMLAEVSQGGAQVARSGDASSKWVLSRGCDPIMAERSLQFLPPMVGNAKMEAVTDDEAFFAKLGERKWDVIFFAPGACRWSAAKQPIPGGNAETRGWSLQQYYDKVRELQGADVKIVGTLEERLIVSSLRDALGLE